MTKFTWSDEALKHHEQQMAQMREAAARRAARPVSDEDEGVCTWMTQHGTTGQWR